MDTDGTVRHPGLDNHGMGTVFEELIRRFNKVFRLRPHASHVALAPPLPEGANPR